MPVLRCIRGDEAAADIAPLIGDSNGKVIAAVSDCLSKTGRTGIAAMAAFCNGKDIGKLVNNVENVLNAYGPDAVNYMIEEYAASNDEKYNKILLWFYSITGNQKYTRILDILESGGENKAVALKFIESDISSFSKTADPAQLSRILKMDMPATDREIMTGALLELPVSDMFDVYIKEKDKGIKKIILNNISVACIKTKNYIELFDCIKTSGLQAAFKDFFESMDETGIKSLVEYYTKQPVAALKIIKTMNSNILWYKLSPFLEKGDMSTAYLIGDLHYPEYLNKILVYIRNYEDYDGLISYQLLKNYKDDRLLEFFKTAESIDKIYLLDYFIGDIPVNAYIAGMNYKKKGPSGGPINKVVVIEKDEDQKPYVSRYTYSLVPSDKWLSVSDPGNADAALYIIKTYKYSGKYIFSSIHKTAKGYRASCKITLVDLRTKKVLASKTLKGPKLPKTVFSNELYEGKYYGSFPDDWSLEAAVVNLLKKYA